MLAEESQPDCELSFREQLEMRSEIVQILLFHRDNYDTAQSLYCYEFYTIDGLQSGRKEVRFENVPIGDYVIKIYVYDPAWRVTFEGEAEINVRAVSINRAVIQLKIRPETLIAFRLNNLLITH